MAVWARQRARSDGCGVHDGGRGTRREGKLPSLARFPAPRVDDSNRIPGAGTDAARRSSRTTSVFEAVHAAQARPSILSGLLCRVVYGDPCGAPAQYLPHSDSAPDGSSLPEFFEKYVKTFLPPIHFEHARYIERACGCEFLRQWAFEWQQLVDRLNAPMSIEPLREWMGGAQEGDYRPVVVDTWMSEIYRSSYLRALHWAVSERALAFGDAITFASELCPVGLLLWRCKPNVKPTWWPDVSPESDGPLDVAPAAIFEAVEDLWNRQRQRQLWDGEKGLGTSCVLGATRGIVLESTVKYYLEIAGVFQRAVGPEKPPPERVGAWSMRKACAVVSDRRSGRWRTRLASS